MDVIRKIRKDITGQRFGRFVAVKPVRKDKKWFYQCQCDCGNTRVVNPATLRNGTSQSCGCLQADVTRERNMKHGSAVRGKTKPSYRLWCAIKTRCFDSNYARFEDYGGRGITMHKPWIESYSDFHEYIAALPNAPKNINEPGALMDMQIDRYPDNDGHYEPGNLRWVTVKQQQNNKRSTFFIKVNSKRTPFSEAVDNHSVVPYMVAYTRIKKLGWNVRDALKTPLGSVRRKRQ